MELLSVNDLNYTYEGSERPALQGIHLQVEKGELILLCGACGCGKSTLLKLLKKQYPAAGYLFQNPESQIVCEYVEDELVFGAENCGMSREWMARQIAELSAYLGIEDLLEKKTMQLSGGQKQMMNLAALLLMNPPLLLLDEPLSQLDPVSRWEFVRLVDKLREEMGLTILVAEHHLEYFLEKADRMLFLEEGRISYEGAPEGLIRKLHQEKHSFFTSMPEVVRLAYACHIPEKTGQIPYTIQEFLRDVDREEMLFPENKPVETKEGEVVLRIKNGYFRYEKDSPDVLRDMNIELEKGKIYGLIGGNGTGKSTLFSILSGSKKLYHGRYEKKGKIVILPQNPAYVFLQDTLWQDCRMLASEEEILALQNKYQFFRGVEDWYQRNPLDLSGGEMQKAAIFKMLLSCPDVFLFDEPVKALDGCEKERFLSLLAELKADGMTIFMISHDLECIQDGADECFMMFRGAMIVKEKPEKIFQDNRFYTTAKGRIMGILNDAVFTGN